LLTRETLTAEEFAPLQRGRQIAAGSPGVARSPKAAVKAVKANGS